jgi:hypothetical protein
VATLDKSARDGARKADNDLSACRQGSGTLIGPLDVYERRKELDGGAVCLGALIYHETRLSGIRWGGDDAIKISELLGLGRLRIGQTTRPM